ncbi:MAG: DUF883 family protein [Acidobacteriota bacterium]
MANDTTNNTDDSKVIGRETVDRAAQSAHEAIDKVASKAGPAIEQLQSAANTAAKSLQDKAVSLGEMEEVWMDAARTCVREHPLTSVLVALAAGMLISRLSN